MSVDAVYLVDVALPVPLPETFTYRCPSSSDGRAPVRGDLVRVPFGRRRRVIGLVTEVGSDHGDRLETEGMPLRDVETLLPEVYRLDPGRLRLAEWMARYYALPLGEVVPLFHPPSPGTRSRGAGAPPAAYPLSEPREVTLTESQRVAVAAAGELLTAGRYGALLLHGVTGSGKTEVYLRVIDDALSRGRGAIYLLPEIALTPQTLARIHVRFGDRAAAIHSGLSQGERCRVHEAAARGEVQVVVGPRSALFAPVRDLGAVIVDEEHETSYKQEEKPRYHARDVALVRGRECGAVVLLGSATPELVSWRNARQERYRLVAMPERLSGPLPRVDIVDLRGEEALDGFGNTLMEGLGEVLAAGRQAILFYNRRGFARQLQCRDCGEAVTCPHCDIGLVVHLRPRRLLCHYCGHSVPVLDRCPTCADGVFLPAGGGTEKIELILQASFPEARLLRLDHDTTRRRGSHGRILSAFAAGEADILVGTQMVAKGHHFPGVDLVGVLAADDGLSLPDYRGSERTFQLLTQVAGRAGREVTGRVLFQTWQPEHTVVLAAADHDYATFAQMEMGVRRSLGYPPFRRLVRLGIGGRRLAEVESAAGELAAALRAELQGPDRDLLGPAPAVFPRLQGRFRHQILLKGTLTGREKDWLASCCRALKGARRGVDVVIDVDPVAMF